MTHRCSAPPCLDRRRIDVVGNKEEDLFFLFFLKHFSLFFCYFCYFFFSQFQETPRCRGELKKNTAKYCSFFCLFLLCRQSPKDPLGEPRVCTQWPKPLYYGRYFFPPLLLSFFVFFFLENGLRYNIAGKLIKPNRILA